MVPISAAMLAPTLPARASPVSTGPSSIIMVFPTRAPDEVERHRAGEDVFGKQGEHDAGEDGDEQRDRHRVHSEPAQLGRQEREPGAHIGERATCLDGAAADLGDGGCEVH